MVLHIENVVIGNLLVDPKLLFSASDIDWNTIEEKQTVYTQERYLPKILVELGFTKSTSEIRRNRKET